MDLSMSTPSTSMSALGLLTNTEPIRMITDIKSISGTGSSGGDKSDASKTAKKDEVRLIFFGTFFHDSNELNADLVQIKEPTQIKEIRVIPLGATVNLSTGSYQLGATNPSELELEFYYNDLQVPTKSAFTLLQNFSFNDKCKIHLAVDPTEQIITDGLIVRGVYSTITLAVYGCSVEEVPVKTAGKSEQQSTAENKEGISTETVKDITKSPIEDSKKLKDTDSTENLTASPPLSNDEGPGSGDINPKGAATISTPTLEESIRRSTDSEEPKAIPTITTSRGFDTSSFVDDGDEEESLFIDEREHIDKEEEVSDLSSDDDQFETNERNKLSSLQQSQIINNKPIAPAPTLLNTTAELGLSDAEDISDAEVFPEDDADDLDISGGKLTPQRQRDRVSPNIEPLSDQEDSMLDEFQQPGIEEIISDEEMPDFPEYEYGELDEQWGQVFGTAFNPFSDSFRVVPLKYFKVMQTFGPVARTLEEMISCLESKAEEWSRKNFDSLKLETWVQDMEELVPMIPRICDSENDISDAIKETLFYWTSVGLDLTLAKNHSQLPFKTRHIKVGIKLLHALSISDDKMVEALIAYKQDDEDTETIQEKLIEIFKEQFMSTTMRLSILRALDCMILTKPGFRAFVGDEDDDDYDEGETCYSRLIEITFDKSIGTRVSFSIHSFLNKVKLLEDLDNFEKFVLGIVKNSSSELSTSVEAQDVDDCVHILENLRDLAKKVDQYLSHPLRILPARSLVELPSPTVTGHDPKVLFIKALEQYQFVKLCTVLVNNKDLSGRTGGLISEIISILLEWECGLVYLCSEGESTTILLKTLAQIEDEGSNTALYACHCLEVIKCIDKIMELDNVDPAIEGAAKSNDEDSYKSEDIACLQTLVSFLATPLGRQCLSSTLTIGDLIVPLLNCLKSTTKDYSVRRGYASRVVGFIVRNGENSSFLSKHGSHIYEIISGMEEDVDGLNGNVSQVTPFLRPILDPHLFSLEGVEELFSIVKSSVDSLLRVKNARNNWGYPPELTTALRLLCGQAVPNVTDDAKNCIPSDVDHMIIKELKYDVALVKLHSLDSISTFISILQKITEDFNGQPSTQSYTLVSDRGDSLINLLSPMLKIVRRIISQVVHVRKTDFKDTTAVPVLLHLYSVIECIPANAPCYRRSREVGQNIIGTLLSYTIPALRQGVETEEELNKSTWTAVISEIIKYTMEEPATFITGVSIFSELLPLPLPIASKVPLTEAECMENVKLRRLWSAYIHGLSSQIQEMIGVLCSSTNSKLITLLKRLCVQLADLSGSTCMVVCRAILDSVSLSIENDMEMQQQSQGDSSQAVSTTSSQTASIKAWLDQSKPPKLHGCSSNNTARLLGFLSSLINNSGTIKSGIMQALRGVLKLDEKYTDLITQFCYMVMSNSGSLTTNHVQAQENIITIFQSLCDQEINVIVPMYGYSGKIYDSKFVLANSLPPKDLFITICNTLINYIATTRYKFSESRVMEGVLRGLEIISETEYGFYHLRNCIEKVPALFRNILVTVAEFDLTTKSDTFDAAWSCISSIVELLRSLTSPRHGTGTNRGSILTKTEFKIAVDWQGEYKKLDEDDNDDDDDSTEGMDEDEEKVSYSNPYHPLARLLKLLQKLLNKINNSMHGHGSSSAVTVEAQEVESTCSMLASVLEYLEEEKEPIETISETILPVPDLLQDLFSKRPVFVIVEKLGSENLPTFWLTSIPPAFDIDSEYSESVVCDLNELCQSFIPELDVIKEIERFYKLTDGLSGSNADKTEQASNIDHRSKIKMDTLHKSIGLSNLPPHRKPFGSHMRGNMRGFGRGISSGLGRGLDPFRSRPPNTSRPPSLHVDDFVALESSGQSGSVAAAYNKGGMRQDSFNRGGRGNPRGSMIGRGYNDRGRFRGGMGGNSYFSGRDSGGIRRGSRGGGRGDGINRHHGGGGPGGGGGNDQRWGSSGSGDNRGDNSYGHPRNRYDDNKFRSSTPMRSSLGSTGSGSRGHYPSRNPYREAPPIRGNSGIGGGGDGNVGGGGSTASGLRWRDRRRAFNR